MGIRCLANFQHKRGSENESPECEAETGEYLPFCRLSLAVSVCARAGIRNCFCDEKTKRKLYYFRLAQRVWIKYSIAGSAPRQQAAGSSYNNYVINIITNAIAIDLSMENILEFCVPVSLSSSCSSSTYAGEQLPLVIWRVRACMRLSRNNAIRLLRNAHAIVAAKKSNKAFPLHRHANAP